MKNETKLAVDILLALLEHESSDGRVEAVKAITNNRLFCEHCGYNLRDGVCHCQNDE